MTAFHRTSQMLMVAFAPTHKLLPVNLARDFENLASLFQNANISRVLFLRHGQTAPSNGVDFERLLTDEGRNQARQAGTTFGKSLNPFFRSVLVSPAPRTMETAELFLESLNVTANVIPVDVLYDGTMQPKGSELFKIIGYAPLKDYLDNENEQYRSTSQQLLGAYADACVEVIMNTVSSEMTSSSQPSPILQKDSTLLMVGHAIYLPAAVLGLSSLLGCKDTDIVLQTNTREAEGYLVDITEQSVKYLSRN
jgi:hypothetical protein